MINLNNSSFKKLRAMSIVFRFAEQMIYISTMKFVKFSRTHEKSMPKIKFKEFARYMHRIYLFPIW